MQPLADEGTTRALIRRWAPRAWAPADRTTRLGLATLLALALVAFVVRLVGVLRGGGLTGVLGFDDTVYFTASVAFVEGRLPYRDFHLLHPPGILYLLAPFGLAGAVTGDAAAFAMARLGMMALGALNTVLVGLVGRRTGWPTAICAAAVYAVWVVPVDWDRTTYLVAPQVTLLLLAMLALTGRAPSELTWRRVAAAGAAIGAAGAIQVWNVVPAAVVLGWLVVTARADVRRLPRLVAAYVAGGVVAAVLLLLPFLVTTGARMLQLIVVAQLARTGEPFHPARLVRLRMLEGVPVNAQLGLRVPDAVVVGAFLAAVALIAFVAWRRAPVRLWAVVLAAQVAFVMSTPAFFPHYGGWPAPLAALCLGATAAALLSSLGRVPRRAAIGLLAGGLLFLAVVDLRAVGGRLQVTPDRPDLSQARCVTADAPILLIRSGALRRDLDRGCPLLANPTSLSHVYNGERGGWLNRGAQPEYQAAMAGYYGGSDAALFMRLGADSLSDATWAAIVASLPVERRVGDVIVRLRAAP
jgi:hypothetical protein